MSQTDRKMGDGTRLAEAAVRQHAKTLHLPTVGAGCVRLAEEAERARQSYLGYLEALLGAEVEERERNGIAQRIRDARLPKVKTLEEFDFSQAPGVSAARIAQLAEGAYIGRAEPVVFIGEAGTGKTHLLTGLCVAACRQRRRVRFTTAAGLVNELVEAKTGLSLSRVLSRWAHYELVAIDEVGYVPLAEAGAELLFQVIADRAEKAAVILTIMWNMGILSKFQGSVRWVRWLEEADREARRLWLRDRSSLPAGPFRVRGSAPEPPKFS